jgi:hypothetical protein
MLLRLEHPAQGLDSPRQLGALEVAKGRGLVFALAALFGRGEGVSGPREAETDRRVDRVDASVHVAMVGPDSRRVAAAEGT